MDVGLVEHDEFRVVGAAKEMDAPMPGEETPTSSGTDVVMDSLSM